MAQIAHFLFAILLLFADGQFQLLGAVKASMRLSCSRKPSPALAQSLIIVVTKADLCFQFQAAARASRIVSQ